MIKNPPGKIGGGKVAERKEILLYNMVKDLQYNYNNLGFN